jgi:holin-like protein
MISGLVQILLCQGAGEVISQFVFPILPGPVIGLLILLVALMLKGSVNESLAQVAGAFSQYLGVLFVPAAVGVILFLPQLRANAFAVVAALVISVGLSIAVTALVLRFFDREKS